MQVVRAGDPGVEARWRDMPRIAVGSLRSSVSAMPASAHRWVSALWAALAWAAAAGGPLTGLAAAVGVLVVLCAVACQVGILVVARIAPRRRLLADVAPAYVASLRLRPTRLQGQTAWDAADYTAHPRGHGHGAALRNRLERLATAEQKAIVLRAANRDFATKLYAEFTPLPGQHNARRPRLVWRPPTVSGRK